MAAMLSGAGAPQLQRVGSVQTSGMRETELSRQALADQQRAMQRMAQTYDPKYASMTEEEIAKLPDHERNIAAAAKQQDAAEQSAIDQYIKDAEVNGQEMMRMATEEKAAADRLNDMRTAVQATMKELDGATVDPGKFWASPSALRKTVGFLGIAMGGFLQGLSNGRIQNIALAMVDKAIDRDIAAQEAQLRKKSFVAGQRMNALGMLQRELGDIRGAKAALKSLQYKRFSDYIGKIEHSAERKLGAARLQQSLLANSAQSALQYSQTYAKQVSSTRDIVKEVSPDIGNIAIAISSKMDADLRKKASELQKERKDDFETVKSVAETSRAILKPMAVIGEEFERAGGVGYISDGKSRSRMRAAIESLKLGSIGLAKTKGNSGAVSEKDVDMAYSTLNPETWRDRDPRENLSNAVDTTIMPILDNAISRAEALIGEAKSRGLVKGGKAVMYDTDLRSIQDLYRARAIAQKWANGDITFDAGAAARRAKKLNR